MGGGRGELRRAPGGLRVQSPQMPFGREIAHLTPDMDGIIGRVERGHPTDAGLPFQQPLPERFPAGPDRRNGADAGNRYALHRAAAAVSPGRCAWTTATAS